MIQKRLIEPEGVDILEEGLWQSARALSEERRDHIAALVKNGLAKEQIDLLATKKLLLVLSQLNDLEVVLLRSFADRGRSDEEFQKKFGEAIEPVNIWIGAPQDQLDKHAISESMRAHLVQLGLLRPHFQPVRKGEVPEFDSFSGKFRT